MTSSKLSFQSGQFVRQLSQQKLASFTGYCRISLEIAGSEAPWYLAFSQGRVIYLGPQPLSWDSLLSCLDHYNPRLRQPKAQALLETLKRRATPDQQARLSTLVTLLEKMKLSKLDDVIQSLRLSILSNLDLFLYEPSGQFELIEVPELIVLAPIQGFALSEIITESLHRRNQWDQLQIPSLNGIPVLNETMAHKLPLKPEQQQRLEQLTAQGQSLMAITYDLGRDPLDVAKMVANWIRLGWVTLKTETVPTPTYTILAIDDSPAMQTMIRRSLQGFRVLTTGNPAEGLSLVFQQKPHLVILDLTMPDIDGLDICRTIRETPQFKNTPIIILTARDKLVDRFRGRLVGADTYLTKPFEPETLKQTVSDLLQLNPPPTQKEVALAAV